jgi:hypothetical protein
MRTLDNVIPRPRNWLEEINYQHNSRLYEMWLLSPHKEIATSVSITEQVNSSDGCLHLTTKPITIDKYIAPDDAVPYRVQGCTNPSCNAYYDIVTNEWYDEGIKE